MSSCAPLALSLAPVADSDLVGCAVGVGPPPPEGLAVQGLVTEALARAERAEAEREGYRREAVAQRSKAHAFAGQFRQCREKLAASRAAHDALGRSAKETLALQREVARLSALVAAMGGDGRKRSTNASLRLENGRLRQQVKAQSKALAAMRHACDTRDKEWARVRAQQARLQADHDEQRRQLEVLSDGGEHGSVAARIQALEATVATLRAIHSNRNKRQFGSKSEQQPHRQPSGRKRGQQPGTPGHGRTPRAQLAAKPETHQPADQALRCPGCNQPYAPQGARRSELIEIEVKAHRRVIERARYRATCHCPHRPLQAVAAPVPRLFPNTAFGVSFWAMVLREKYEFHRPFHSIARWMSGQGLAVSAGTLCDSIRRFIPLFSPLSEAIRAHHNQAAIQQGDETSWRIQELGVGGGSQRAWLWLALSADAAWFHIDPSRSTDAAKTLFAGAAPGTILVCDRYSSYKALARQLDLVLAFCWSHARRDFIDCEGAHVTPWKHAWLERIAALFKANATRLEHYDPNLDTDRQSPALRTAQHRLEATFEHLFNTAEHDLNDREASDPRAKPLRALLSHRQGLGVFVNHPKVPMDNNASERTFRAAANARKLCFGSDSQAGARFTAMMYSVFITCHLNAIDVTQWLRVWLEACAGNGGHPPRDLGPWLPWSMDPARKRTLSVAPARPP